MSLALNVKSLVFALASKPQVLENCPILGSRTAVFFELKFCRSREKNFEDLCFWRSPENFSEEDFFFGEHLRLSPLPLASRGPVLGRAVLGLGLFCVLGLKPCVLDSTFVNNSQLVLWIYVSHFQIVNCVNCITSYVDLLEKKNN